MQEAEDREKMLPDLRKESRRAYLAKRKVDKLVELEQDIMDDEFLFDESQLTEREKEERLYKRKVLELAKQHDKASEIEKVQRYQMPSDKGELHSFLEEDEKEKRAGYEQKKWEEEHLQQATLKFGAKDAKMRHQERYSSLTTFLFRPVHCVLYIKFRSS